jgi:hypothetical protein
MLKHFAARVDRFVAFAVAEISVNKLVFFASAALLKVTMVRLRV